MKQLFNIFLTFFKLSPIMFGSCYALIPVIQQEIVEKLAGMAFIHKYNAAVKKTGQTAGKGESGCLPGFFNVKRPYHFLAQTDHGTLKGES
ncbi:hypothetical protein M3221_09400 [Domibacillus indicus]|uniref:hypothetical protein n=1 Tax=Domibacillus indicus TaxID=1437523 RepID=UPI0020408B38|nr:hypothetical protein [Domibacillus indicus]MCM3788615.1 hypothetical protein [Domibacillus indicus]